MAAGAVVSFVSCAEHGPRSDITGVHITITSEVDVTSFVVRGTGDSVAAFEQVIVPEVQRPIDRGGEVVDIIVDDGLGGTTLSLRVDAIAWGDIYATERVEVALVSRELVPMMVHFGPRTECGDGALDPEREACDDGDLNDGDGCNASCELEPGFECTTDPGQRSRCEPLCGEVVCDEGQRCVDERCICDGQSCAGCCDGDACLAGDEASSCGSGGQTCEACGGSSACVGGVCESCSATTCADGCCSGNTCYDSSPATCGMGGAACTSCTRPETDGCSADGTCLCGTSPACGSGQRCVDGACVCDAVSCPDGCCAGDRCASTLTVDECGTSGEACIACDALTANTCTTAGQCRCGSRRPCLEGQRCRAGTCVCDAGSCPEGCCLDNLCISPPVMAACGLSGAICAPCDLERSDACDVASGCGCGDLPPCPAGLHCVDGECQCDTTSCTGCCADGVCRTGEDTAFCGSGGAECTPCPAAETCAGGVCQGCSATTCADGCCSGSTCSTPDVTSCGVNGAACVACDVLRSDGCTAGACACGSGTPCTAGQRCESGTCICDGTSCPAGCCDGSTCRERDRESCGIGGAECVACDSGTSDMCDITGTCRCGATPACTGELICVAGWCV